MPTLPLAIATVIGAFAPVFSRRVFEHAKLLIVGAILAPGKRTITSVYSALILIPIVFYGLAVTTR